MATWAEIADDRSKGGVIFLQRLLIFGGFNPGAVDGIKGIKTTGACLDWNRKYAELKPKEDYLQVDERSEKNILTLIPTAQTRVRDLLLRLNKHLEASGSSKRFKVISGTRTYAEQDKLYAQGRTAKGSKVTNAKGGQSNHNWGAAADFGLFTPNGGYILEDKDYDLIGLFCPAYKLEWGGNFKSLSDKPHVQLPSVNRAAFEAGKAYHI